MKRRKLQDKTIDEMAESFVELALSVAKTPGVETRLRAEIQEIEDELKARGTEHYRDLLPLANHANETVRFEAVAATYRIMLGKPQITAKLVQQLAVATGAPFLKRSSAARTVARMSCDKLRNLTSEENSSSALSRSASHRTKRSSMAKSQSSIASLDRRMMWSRS